MVHRSFLPALLTVSLLSGPALSQLGQATPIPFGCQPADLAIYKVPWNSPTTSGAFARTISGNFDSTGGPDLVVRRGFSASFMPNIATEISDHDLPVSVTDMACLPGRGQFGGDAIAVVNGSGLRIVSFDPIAQAFTSPLLNASWAGARQVLASDLNGDGLCDLLGLSSDYQTILRLDQVAGGAFVVGLPFTLGGTQIRVMRTLQWDGDTAAELALVLQTGWGVWELNGTGINVQTKSYVAGDTLAVIQDPSPVDRLAHCGRAQASSGIVDLTVLRPGGQLDAPVALGNYRGVSLAAADLSGSGYDDLVANIASDFKVLRLTNQRHSTNQNGVDYLPLVSEVDLVEAGGPQPSLCAPLAADLDLDGVVDFACAFEAPLGTYTLVKLSSYPRPMGECDPPPLSISPFFRKAEYVDPWMVHFQFLQGCPAPDPLYGARLFLTVSAHGWGLQNLPADLNGKKLEFVLYRQLVSSGVAAQVESPSQVHIMYTIGTDPQVDVVPGINEPWNLKVEIPWTADAAEIMSYCYFFQIRLLPPDGTQGIYSTYVGSFSGFTTPPGIVPGSNPYYLLQLPGAIYFMQTEALLTSATCPPPGYNTNQRLGGMAPQTRVPRLANGLPPQPTPIPPGTTGATGNQAISLPPPPYSSS